MPDTSIWLIWVKFFLLSKQIEQKEKITRFNMPSQKISICIENYSFTVSVYGKKCPENFVLITFHSSQFSILPLNRTWGGDTANCIPCSADISCRSHCFSNWHSIPGPLRSVLMFFFVFSWMTLITFYLDNFLS